VEIIETSIFTHQVQELLSEEEYRLLQIALIQHPESGDLIPHSGGLRKKRWSIWRKGKTRRNEGDLLLGGGQKANPSVDDLCQE